MVVTISRVGLMVDQMLIIGKVLNICDRAIYNMIINKYILVFIIYI